MSTNSLLIKDADFIITMDQERSIIERGSIYIEGPKIIAVGKSKDVPHDADNVIDGKGKIALPGLVNTHHHLDETLLRVVPKLQNAKLYDWLPPLYKIRQELTPEHLHTAALVGLGELLLTGCTLSCDHYYIFPNGRETMIDEEIKAAAELGIRFHPCRGSLLKREGQDFPPEKIVEDVDNVLKRSERTIRRHHDMNEFSMCRIALGPASLLTTTLECLEGNKELAMKYEGVLCNTHIAEVPEEKEKCLETYGMSQLELLRNVGLLGKNFWVTHAVYLDDSDIKNLAKAGTGVAHCPTSNMRLASGTAPVPKMLSHGVVVSLGVDGSASNDTSSMMAELRMCLLANRVKYGADSITATQVLEMATLGGAKVLHRNEVGSIETGKAADIILIDLRRLGYAGAIHDPIAALILCGDTTIVDTSVVNGKVVVKDSKLVEVDERELCEKANELAIDLLNRAEKKTGETFTKREWIRAFRSQ